jgi:hypothetical protein
VVLTSRVAIGDVAHLHKAAEQRDTTVSALVARLVHEHAPYLDTEDASDDLDR